MELFRPVVGQHLSNLPICSIWACPWAKSAQTSTAWGLDFAGHISLKQLDGFTPFEIVWDCLNL